MTAKPWTLLLFCPDHGTISLYEFFAGVTDLEIIGNLTKSLLVMQLLQFLDLGVVELVDCGKCRRIVASEFAWLET